MTSPYLLSPFHVLDASAWVMQRARHVRIAEDAITRWARDAKHPAGGHAETPLDEVEATPDALTNLVLLIDTLNFCFWSAQPVSTAWHGKQVVRFTAFAATVCRAAQDDSHWFEPAYWADMTRERFAPLIPSEGKLLMIDERVAALREAGQAAGSHWQGQFSNAVSQANGHAATLAGLLAHHIGSFRDVANYDGRDVPILKRAQICAADLSCTLSRCGRTPLAGMDQLTAFADYRVPQVLRHMGIIMIADSLAARIEREDELTAGSAEEVELRAATVQAVEQMRLALAARGVAATAWEIDFALWEQSHAADVVVKHHRTRTVYY